MGIKVLGYGYLAFVVVFNIWAATLDGYNWQIFLGICFLGGVIALLCLPFVMVGDLSGAAARLIRNKEKKQD